MENYNIRKIESRDDYAILNIVRSCFEEFGFHRLPHALGNSGHPAVTIWMEKDI